jgi:hypothetical protein
VCYFRCRKSAVVSGPHFEHVEASDPRRSDRAVLLWPPAPRRSVAIRRGRRARGRGSLTWTFST